MKILVLGCKGQVGRCLHDQLKNTNYNVIFTSRENIDITDFEKTKIKILDISPDILINATAFTAVDKAEENHKSSKLINHLAVKNIADICNQNNSWLIHISTDYVFDGNSDYPYKEGDQTNPQNQYGKTKLDGEMAIQLSGCKHIIIRTSWVFSEYGNNFLKNIFHLGLERNELSIIDDQIGCPTYAQDVSSSIVKIIPQLKNKEHNGLYHYCGDQRCSWYDFAKKIFNIAKKNNIKIPNIINSIKTSDYLTLAKRPKFSVLDCDKIEKEFGISPSNLDDGIRHAIARLKI